MYVPRQLRVPLDRALRQFPAVLVTGPRQAGKTTLLREELGGAAMYVSFDDPLDRGFARDDPNGFLDRFAGRRVILDEIQYVPELVPYLKIRIDRDRQSYGRWILTGSQQFELMANISESLAGRIAILELLPLSLVEHPALADGGLAACLWNGAYPEPALDPVKRDLWLASYIRTYIERDVRQILNVQDLRAFETFLVLAAARHGQELKVSDLARDAGHSQPTLKRWLGVLETSYVAYLLPPYFENLGKRVVKSPKLHLLDSALACVLTRQPTADAALAGAMGGALLEAWVVAEAVKVFAMLGRKPEVYYWRSHDGLEVDLVVAIAGKLQPIEVKLTATPTPRHLEPIERFKRLAPGRVVDRGVLVCGVPESRDLAFGNVALPWHEFPGWLHQRLGATVTTFDPSSN